MRFEKLDGMRGLFSLMIILFHYDDYYLPDFLNNFFILHSYVFVDFFFVLSGFVISYNYNSIHTKNELKIFLTKRFLRIYPLHIYTTIIYFLCLVISKIFLSNLLEGYIQSTHLNFEMHILPFLDSIFLLNSTPFLGSSMGINMPSWSISSEIISYLIFGILSYILSKNYKDLAFICLILISVFCLIYIGKFVVSGDYGFLRGILGFLLGYFVYKLNSKLTRIKFSNYLEFILLFLLIIILFLLDHFKNNISGFFIGLFIIPSFFSFSILSLIHTNGFLSKILESQTLKYLGKISYSIYLNHSLILIVLVKPFFTFLNLEINNLSKTFILIIIISIIISYSHFTYIIIEQKVNIFKNWLTKTKKSVN